MFFFSAVGVQVCLFMLTKLIDNEMLFFIYVASKYGLHIDAHAFCTYWKFLKCCYLKLKEVIAYQSNTSISQLVKW